jgi:endo-1,4-beta-xylanase
LRRIGDRFWQKPGSRHAKKERNTPAVKPHRVDAAGDNFGNQGTACGFDRECRKNRSEAGMTTTPLRRALSRRAFLEVGVGAAALTTGATGCALAARPVPATDLRTLAAERNILFGAAAVSHVLGGNPAMAAIYARDVAMIVPDFEMKWALVRPDQATYNYAGADALARFAATHGLRLRGHCLAWEESNPDWLAATATRDNAERILVDHIERVVSRYAGRIHSWDVVNEPIWPDHRKPGGLRDGVWLRTLGPRYIGIAFRAARAADPKAMLVLNEAGTEVTSPLGRRRRQDFLDLLDRLRRDQVPVDAVGLECHLSTKAPFEQQDFADYLSALGRRGYKILISELDVSDFDEPSPDADVRDHAVATVYRQLVSTAANEPAVVAILTWELSDKYTWLRDANLTSQYRREDGLAARPLPYDDLLQKKACWWATAQALASAG